MSDQVLLLPGAQKSASTTLFRILLQHPRIFTSAKKEPHFFSKDSIFEESIASYMQREFADRGSAAYCLDASQSYLGVERVPHRILEVLGQRVRFIVILRHPVDRAESAFRHFRTKDGGEIRSIENLIPSDLHNYSLDELLAWEEVEVRCGLADGSIIGRDPSWSREGFPFRYFRGSAYSNQIQRYLELFPRPRFLFLTFEEVTQEQETTMQRVWDFLELPPHVPSEGEVHANKTLQYKREGVGSVILAVKKRIRPVKRILPDRLLHRVRRIEEATLLERRRDRFDPSVRRELIRIFGPDVETTGSLTGLDLSAWLADTVRS